MRCYTMNESRVDMKVHQNTMDPVLFDFVRKVLSFPPSHCRLLPTSTRNLPAYPPWSCAFVLFLQLSVEVCHYRLRTAIPRDRFSEGNQLVAGRAGRPDSVGDGKGNQLSHLAHASGHQGVFREERAVDVGLQVAAVHSVGDSRRSDWAGGVQVSRVFRHRDDVALFLPVNCRNADNGFYDDELAECFEQRRNVGFINGFNK